MLALGIPWLRSRHAFVNVNEHAHFCSVISLAFILISDHQTQWASVKLIGLAYFRT